MIEQYIEEITEGADKQLKIQVGLAEIMEKWEAESFVFNEWKGRGINVLKGTGTIVEELEEAQVRYLALGGLETTPHVQQPSSYLDVIIVVEVF